MTDSTVFSINLTYLRIPANPNYHISIKKSQAILKCFLNLKFSVWFTLGSENETMFCNNKHSSERLSVNIDPGSAQVQNLISLIFGSLITFNE